MDFEHFFQQHYGLGLNEGMLLCTLLKSEKCSSGEIAAALGLTSSNASKIIVSVENKRLIQRSLGDSDRRQMYFSLTADGKAMMNRISGEDFELPELLKDLLKQ
jgi:DNA-binding MarR family transcriptional regulator